MIVFDNVSKRYQLGSGQGSLREVLSAVPRLLGRRRGGSSSPDSYHWALREVSFHLNKGEALGIVGRNGAGKTTILKLMSKITKPTSGRVLIDGRVSALIELGAGFHPDLTGRDNIYLNGIILGLSRREVDQQFESIVEFAELASFIDTPVKRYSSGMYARLGFSVAAHTHPDVLVVDEVLAVGDSNFRQKCYDFIHSFVNSGRTTVFVSHDPFVAEQLCQRVVWLQRGEIAAIGNPSRVVEQYLSFMEEHAAEQVETPSLGHNKVDVLRVQLADTSGQPRQVFTSGEDVIVSVDYATQERVKHPHFCVWISETPAPDPLFAANMMIDGDAPAFIAGEGTIQCVFKNIPLMPRVYYVWVEVWGEDRAELLFQWQRLGSFHVVDPTLLLNIDERKGAVHFSKSHGPIRVPYEWRMTSNSRLAEKGYSVGD